MQADSPLVTEVVPSLSYQLGNVTERREYGATVTHITTRGPLRRLTEPRFARWRRRHLPDSEPVSLGRCAAAVYASVMPKAGPHYVLGPDCDIYQTCPEEHGAWAVGGAGHRIYTQTHWLDERTDWWIDRWAPFGYGSPLDLADGALWGISAPYSANAGAIHIEFAWPFDKAGSFPTERQMQAWARLIRDIHMRHCIPLEATHVLGHSDAHPRARSRKGDPWDPPPWFSPSRVAYWLGITTGPPT